MSYDDPLHIAVRNVRVSNALRTILAFRWGRLCPCEWPIHRRTQENRI